MNIILLTYYDFTANVGHSALCPSRFAFLLSAIDYQLCSPRVPRWTGHPLGVQLGWNCEAKVQKRTYFTV